MHGNVARSVIDMGVASSDEVAEALAALSANDITRLNKIAKMRARHAPGLDWRDLLHDAIERGLDGRRKWPRSLPFLVFLREIMRSQASEYFRRVRGPVQLESDVSGDGDASPVAAAVCERPGPEREALASQLLQAVRDEFADDAAALAIIDGIGMGLGPEEIQSEAGLSPTAYATAQKRIRRGLSRAFPSGVES